mgnify:CR=1 FL=1
MVENNWGQRPNGALVAKARAGHDEGEGEPERGGDGGDEDREREGAIQPRFFRPDASQEILLA